MTKKNTRGSNRRGNNNVHNTNRGRNTNQTSRPRMPIDPPQTSQMRVIRQTTRYIYGGSTTKNIISRRCLLNTKVAFYSDGTTAQTGSLVTSIRLLSVRAWATTTDGPSTIGFTWLGDNALQNTTVDSGSTTRPAKLHKMPPPQSTAAEWISTGSDNLDDPLFDITCPPSTTLDITVLYVLQDWTALTYAGILPAMLPAAGLYVYTPPLDNVTTANVPGNGNFQPLFMDGQLGD